MIVCDFCGKKEATETYILYSQTIDFCKDCKDRAKESKKAIKEAIEYYVKEKDKNIRETENKIIKKIKNKKIKT